MEEITQTDLIEEAKQAEEAEKAGKKEKTEQEEDKSRDFVIALSNFSGPLDLLCAMVDSRELNALEVSLVEVVSQYVAFLKKLQNVTLEELGEFFNFATRLILRKCKSLNPANQEPEPELDDFYDEQEPEIDIEAVIARYKPYRIAATWLARAKAERENYFARGAGEEEKFSYDIGDVEFLASKWWRLLYLYEERMRANNDDEYFDDSWDEIPDAAVPDEQQIEARMTELYEMLSDEPRPLIEFLTERNHKNLIITIMAMLEMSRLWQVEIIQNETLGCVELARKTITYEEFETSKIEN